jgi:hypothetical protein
MAEKPKALRLANELGGVSDQLADEAAAELRRLHHENERLKAEVLMEREACADICDQHASIEGIAQRCAEQIRARSKT